MEKIGNFFVKIGQGIKKGFIGLINWVKNTAWIQPLLIVGLIFGVILSIKPVTSWITGLLNPDTTYLFFKDNNAEFSKDLDEDYKTKSKDGKTYIVIYYSDDDSDCANIESTLRTLKQDLGTRKFDWNCINTNFEEEDDQKFFEDNFNDDEYNIIMGSLIPSKENENLYASDLVDKDCYDKLSNDDGDLSLPLPLFVRYTNGEICGVKAKYNTDISGNKAYYDIKRFVSGDPTTDWTLSLTDYIIKQDN